MNDLQVSYEGRRYRFEQGHAVRIGRATDNDIIVSDPTVSRQHGRVTWGPDGWTYEGQGRAGTFLRGTVVTRLLVREPVDLALASPQGPVIRLEPRPAPPAVTRPAGGFPGAAAEPGPAGGFPGAAAEPGRAGGFPGAAAEPGRAGGVPVVAAGPGGRVPATPAGAAGPVGAAPPGPGPFPGVTPVLGAPVLPAAAAPWGQIPPGPRIGAAGDELASAFQILVPVRSWLKDPGWRQGLRLLVIAYALLPLVFLALFASSGNLTTPGWAYSLYIAPLWGLAFWLLIRPPQPYGKQEVLIGIGVIIWVMIWMSIVTINVNRSVNPKGFGGALALGFNEEVTKALPILVAALALLRLRSVKLDVRMWMFLGTIAGLTFGVREASEYTTVAIENIAGAALAHSANEAVVGALTFAYRVFVDGFQHAIWAGLSAFFIGIAVNYPRRRIPLIVFGVTIAAVLHAVNDWYLSNFGSPWPWVLLQAFSLLLFLGYTMSAASIERKVRRTPLFRGDSMLMDKFTESGT